MKSESTIKKSKITEGKLHPELSFKMFIFRKNRSALYLVAACLILEFTVFKVLYPYANFMPDSYGYLEAAMGNWDIHIWAVGYSKFLRLFRVFTHSDTALVFTQYFLLEAAILFFIFTLSYLLKPGIVYVKILLAFFVLNPLILSVSNYISADALFTSLSLIWITQLLWILYRPKPYYIWTHALILFLTFTVRYNALYYPFIAIAVFLCSHLRWPLKISGIALSILFVGTFVWYNCNKYYTLTGERQFSAFSGWQMASNALFMYCRVQNDNDAPPEMFSRLHQITKVHLDSLQYLKNRPDSTLGIYYLWDKAAPLQRYMEEKRGKAINNEIYFKNWASMGKLYSAYGSYLIRKHTVPFAKYYLWPNIVNYYVPPTEVLCVYNMKLDDVSPLAQSWFSYNSTRVKSFSKEMKILNVYSTIMALINTLFIYGFVMFIFTKRLKQANLPLLSALLLSGTVWLANFCFSILASPIVLRYQLFPMVLFFSFAVLILERLLKSDNPAIR